MIFYTSKSTFIFSNLIFSMPQCAVRQFENELVERLSILAERHLRPPAPGGVTVSIATTHRLKLRSTVPDPRKIYAPADFTL
jgi:hypothetical protein